MKKTSILIILLLLSLLVYAQDKVGFGTLTLAFKLDVQNGSINTDSLYRNFPSFA